MEKNKENRTSRRKSTYERKQCYRELLSRVEELQESEDKGIQAVIELGSILEEVNSLETENQENADETMLDSMVLSSASNFLVKCVEAVNVSTLTFHSTEFSSKLVNSIKDRDGFKSENLLKLINKANDIVPLIPQYSFIFGTFEPNVVPEPKQRKVIQRQKAEKVEKKQLQQVQNLEKEEEDVNETVNILHKVLEDEYKNNDNHPISYYEFITDTNSFEETVKNMFYFSFLLRDGKAALEIDDNNEAKIKPKSKQQLKEFRGNGGTNTQMICSLDVNEWQNFRIKEGIVQKYKKFHNHRH